MDRYKAGMMARSLAGHDAGKIYVIIGSDSAYVYLADGRLRTVDHRSVDRPKKKKKKHVQPVCVRCEEAALDDVAVKRILRNYLNQEKGKQED